MTAPIPCFFHEDQLKFQPVYEWVLGNKIDHPETTRRAQAIYAALKADPERFALERPPVVEENVLLDLHSERMMTLYRAAEKLEDGDTFHPSVFPHRRDFWPNPQSLHHAGFFCFDSGTPLNNRTWVAATWSAASAHAAASRVVDGTHRLTYSLSRPPGHHASHESFGGYCYFNNAAVAARVLRQHGTVAILDIDFHHGNGTQEVFYPDGQVLTVSIHGDPRTYFPYMSGFPAEHGVGLGEGFNFNILLEPSAPEREYLELLDNIALPTIRRFDPKYLIVAAGFDTYKDDPVGDAKLETDSYFEIGRRIASLDRPTIVVQEGGYLAETLGENVVSLLSGLSA